MSIMKGRIFFFLLLLFIIIGILLHGPMAKAAINANNGMYEISTMSRDEILEINGEWEFYWKQLYTPDDFKQTRIQHSSLLVEVPDNWTSYSLDGNALPNTGYATYRLHIQLPKEEVGTLKAIYMPSAASASSLWLNGEKKLENGVVGESREKMKPASRPGIITFLADSQPVELIIQVSNFHQRRAGLSAPILIGEPETIYTYNERSVVYREFIVVSLIIIGMYHIVLFLFRRKEWTFLFFAVFCIVIAIRATILEGRLATYLLPFLGWEVSTKLEYLGASIGIMFLTLFTYTQFPQDVNWRVRNSITLVFAAYSLFITFTPGVIFTQTMLLLQLLIVFAFLYLLYVYFLAAKRKREGSYLNAVATFILFLLVLNDILYYNHLINTTELTSVGLFLFLFTQAIILSKRYSNSFSQAERLSEDLRRLNSSLEEQVRRRTMELEKANHELNVTNEKLYDSQQSKNKWIRNILHEIATPLTSILSYTRGMIDGIIPPDKKYIQLINDQSSYLSRMLSDLHDVSEMENNKIQFSLEKLNIREYTRQIYEKYKWDLEKQGIQFTYKDLISEHPRNSFVMIDPTRIEQVIVNLVSNAQRFVGEEGKITLELVSGDERAVTIKVKDNGMGVKEGELDLLFNRSYKNSNRGKPHHGAGLGLTIAKEIIDFHQGTISVESTPGKGSCFYFTLPFVT